MSWCPKCKNEYRDDIKVCSDCGCELVSYDKLQEAQSKPVIFGTKEEMSNIQEFLQYNGIFSSTISFDETEKIYELYVTEEDMKQSLKFISVYLKENAKSEDKKQEEMEYATAPVEPIAVNRILKSYESSAVRAEDNRSSAFVLLFCGGVGLILEILFWFGIIPLPINVRSMLLSFVVMTILFFVFLVMGIISLKTSKTLQKVADCESNLAKEIKEWCVNNVDASQIDTQLFGENTENEDFGNSEMKYFKRTEMLKNMIQQQFMNLDESFVEHFIDDNYEVFFTDETP